MYPSLRNRHGEAPDALEGFLGEWINLADVDVSEVRVQSVRFEQVLLCFALYDLLDVCGELVSDPDVGAAVGID